MITNNSSSRYICIIINSEVHFVEKEEVVYTIHIGLFKLFYDINLPLKDALKLSHFHIQNTNILCSANKKKLINTSTIK